MSPNADEGDICAICRAPLSEDATTKRACSHAYHEACWRQYVDYRDGAAYEIRCPLCNRVDVDNRVFRHFINVHTGRALKIAVFGFMLFCFVRSAYTTHMQHRAYRDAWLTEQTANNAIVTSVWPHVSRTCSLNETHAIVLWGYSARKSDYAAFAMDSSVVTSQRQLDDASWQHLVPSEFVVGTYERTAYAIYNMELTPHGTAFTWSLQNRDVTHTASITHNMLTLTSCLTTDHPVSLSSELSRRLSVFYVLIDNSIFRTTDHGETWKPVKVAYFSPLSYDLVAT